MNGLDGVLEGPTTLVWGGEDIVALSKEIAKWAKEIEPLKIKGGTTEGTALSPATVEALSKSPGRLELIGQIVTLMTSPGARLAGALLGPGGKLASQVKKISEKEEGEAAAEAAGGRNVEDDAGRTSASGRVSALVKVIDALTWGVVFSSFSRADLKPTRKGTRRCRQRWRSSMQQRKSLETKLPV